MRRAYALPIVFLVTIFCAVAGVVLFRVAAVDRTPHSVLLKWNPPPPKPGVTVAGYNIYRSEESGFYEKLATVLTSPTFVDNDVRNRKTYEYLVRAVNPDGGESPPSNQVSVAIP